MEFLSFSDVALGRLIVGAILVGAGTLKIVAGNHLNKDLLNFPIISHLATVSLPITKILLYSIFALEIALGILFALGHNIFLTGTMIISLLVLFTVGVTYLFFKKEKVSCGCFGQVSSRPVGKRTLLRNSLLIIVAATSTFLVDISLEDLASTFRTIPVSFPLIYAVAIASTTAVLLLLSIRMNPFSLYANNIAIYGTPSVQGFRVTLQGLSNWLAHRTNDDKTINDRSKSESSDDPFKIRTNKAYRHQLKNYYSIAEKEKQASILVSKLDGILSESIDRDYLGKRSIKEPITTVEKNGLQPMEESINELLKKMYSEASITEGSEKDKLLLRSALIHWTILVRRVSMRTFHTKVPELQEDHDCRGDVISNQMLLRYFDTLFDPTGGIRSEINAVRALSDLARQSACLGARQSTWLAYALYWSFIELRSFLRVNGLERLIPFVTLAGCAPLLLFYDVEKYRGLQSPLARWFIENRSSLIQGVLTKRIPMIWHGLWLYDRRTGHLFGYRNTSKPKDENDVDIRLFIESIVSRENLGKYDCTFSEMISRGPGKIGYLCAGSSCAKETTIESRDDLMTSWRRGLEEDLITSGVCNSNATNGGSNCRDGVTIGGNKFAASLIPCLTEQLMNTGPQQGKKVLRCVAEATGRCTDPIDKLTKDLKEQAFAGIRVGSKCQIMDEEIDKLQKEYNDAIYKYWEAAGKHAEFMLEHDDRLERPPATVEETIERIPIIAEEAVLRTEMKKAEKEANEAREKLKQAKEGEKVMCPPDTAECGSDNCTALDQATRKTLECLEMDLDSTTRPIERVPGNVDPSPTDGEETVWTKCIESLSQKPDVSRKCWYLDCGEDYNTVSGDGEECSCKQLEGGNMEEERLSSICSHIRCEEGVPTPSQFGCTCGEMDEAGSVPSGRPPRSFDVPSAPRFSDARGY